MHSFKVLPCPTGHWLVVSLIAMLLGACGGGGSSSSATAPAAPVLELTPQSVKTLQFSWTAVEGATAYRLYEDPDGISGYTQVATLGADATGFGLQAFLPGRVNARYILSACNAQSCSDSAEVHVDGMVTAIGYIKPSTTEVDDGFGRSVALSGDGSTLAVGVSGEDSAAIGINGDQADNSAPWSGAVYVFTRSAGEWNRQAYLKAPNTGADDEFGASVAISEDGSTLAVGAPDEASAATGINGDQADNSAPKSGAVYLY